MIDLVPTALADTVSENELARSSNPWSWFFWLLVVTFVAVVYLIFKYEKRIKKKRKR